MRLAGTVLLYAAGLSAADWPPTVRPTLEPCWKVVDTAAGKQRIAIVTGKIETDDYRWTEINLMARVVIRESSGKNTEYTPTSKIYAIRSAYTNTFDFPIHRAPLQVGEDVVSCEVQFVSGTRINRKPAHVTLSVTPLAKDEGCFRDMVSALEAEGVERRKRFDELVRYSCVEAAPVDYVVRISSAIQVQHGTRAIQAVRVTLASPYIEGSEGLKVHSGITLPSFIGEGTTLIRETILP